VVCFISFTYHQENVIYYGTLQTTTEHYVVLCSKIQPTDDYGIGNVLRPTAAIADCDSAALVGLLS
jgi:hypothetical protein